MQGCGGDGHRAVGVMGIDELVAEGELIRSLTHPNVLRAYGLCSEGLQIAAGLEYLHSTSIIHRDVAVRNVLLQSPTAHNCAPRAKVADLGLARRTNAIHSTYVKTSQMPQRLPVRWMAPETLVRLTANEMSDVWAYGIALWETVTDGAMPYPQLTDTEVVAYLRLPTREVLTLIDPVLECPGIVYDVIGACTRIDAGIRPTFTTVQVLVAEVLDSLACLFAAGPCTLELRELTRYSAMLKSSFTWLQPEVESEMKSVLEDRSQFHSAQSKVDGESKTLHTIVSKRSIYVDDENYVDTPQPGGDE
ncbi:TK protein kinase [Sphaeroforma arctica JP610]|uniref:TK protein kinase n=1 Tax=Sphaeroforma arctica JP610 TaxID=667725 RepID=A0A0L0G4A0_9EUKA|nr:TK protein kinase [Sphaeroforma arctica JP610]KNC83927.1 TK protein kinase [Sphaeroforma arctica JP610]|eukprot:XP_014157829.1 TK protein kinase [Sphaeroforma arctica JP610]